MGSQFCVDANLHPSQKCNPLPLEIFEEKKKPKNTQIFKVSNEIQTSSQPDIQGSFTFVFL